jgi:peptidoglycan hydrolase CwlO-like protein
MGSKLVKKWFCGQNHHEEFRVASAMFRETTRALRAEEIAFADRCLLGHYTTFTGEARSIFHDTPEAAKNAKIRELTERVKELQSEIDRVQETIHEVMAIELPQE